MNQFDEEDGLPDAAFTEDELAAGVQHLMRGSYGTKSKNSAWYSSSLKKADAYVFTEKDTQFFDALRNWRQVKARENGVPSYVILQDRTLKELVEHKPLTQVALLYIPGLGRAKIELYGKELLALITTIYQISPIQRKKAENDAPLLAALFNWIVEKCHNGRVLFSSILNDIEILNLVEHKPQSQTELLQVIGRRSVSLYGKELLALLTPLYPASRTPIGSPILRTKAEWMRMFPGMTEQEAEAVVKKPPIRASLKPQKLKPPHNPAG